MDVRHSEGLDASAAFAEALRGWRERRRLSQLELALRAGTTQRHVSLLERGRSVPARGMVVRLTESLDVPLRERNALLVAAGHAPAYPETRPEDPALAPVREALDRVLAGHMPYPAVVIDRRAQLVAHNAAFRLLTDDVAPALLAPPVNVARVLLHPEGLAPRIVNLSQWAWHVVDNVRDGALRHPDPELSALVAELEGYAPERPDDPGLGFSVPLHLRSPRGDLRLLTTLTRFGTTTDVTVAELRLEAFLPADAETAAILAGAPRIT